jgi:hypothetical protein
MPTTNTSFGDKVGNIGEVATTPNDEDDDVDSPSPFAMVADDVVGDTSWSFKEDGTKNTLALFLFSPTMSAEVEDEITGCDRSTSTDLTLNQGAKSWQSWTMILKRMYMIRNRTMSRGLGLCLVWLNCV